MWASGVVAHGLRCLSTCGLLLDQGSNPCPQHWQADSSPLGHQASLLIVVLICISLMVSDVGHLYIFFAKISIQALCSFLIRLFAFLILRFMSSLYILYFFIKYIVCKYLLLFSRWPFHFVDRVPSLCKSFLVLVPFVNFCFCFSCLRKHIQKLLLRLMSKTMLPIFSSRSFVVSQLKFKSLLHLEGLFIRTWCESSPI